MAVIVETGTGSSTSEAYVSVSTVTDYCVKHYAGTTINDAWTAASTAVQEACVRQGAKYLDNTFRRRFKGVRTARDQALQWPRAFVVVDDSRDTVWRTQALNTLVTDNGFLLDSDSIPPRVQNANSELAIRQVVLGSTRLQPDLERGGMVKRQRDKVGSLESETEYFGSAPGRTVYQEVADMLSEFLKPTNTGIRG